jgi:putative transcriptional regulator
VAGEAKAPKPAEIRKARERAGLTQTQAAELVHSSERLWRYWEHGTHRMPPGLWELFEIKVACADGEA